MSDGKRPTGGGNRHPRSLANLAQNRGELPTTAWQPGDAPARTHGYRSRLPVPVSDDELVEIRDAFAASAPVRDSEGQLPAADEAAVERAARALKRWRSISTWCDLHGRLEERTGNVKAAAKYELEAEQALGRALSALGMDPLSRSKLGLNLARSFDLAQAMAADGEAERRELELGERRNREGDDA